MSAHAPDGILLVDKASGMTSHDVVARARRALQTRSVGHAGTLDPMATGVLVLGVGQGTKLLHYLTADDKRYEATLAVGVATDSLDADGEVVGEGPLLQVPTVAAVRSAAAGLLGTTQQVAPAISAIKQGGEALYKKARRGEAVSAPTRTVALHSLEIDAVQPDAIALRVHCGKGFYVRALGRDLCAALGTVGHLTRLRRTASGGFLVADSLPVADLLRAAAEVAARPAVWRAVLPLAEAAVAALPSVRVDAAGATHLRHGRPAPLCHLQSSCEPGEAAPAPDIHVAVLDPAGALIAVAVRRGDALHTKRGFPAPA